MAISINSDLILGVTNAANPARLQMARAKLNNTDQNTAFHVNLKSLIDKRLASPSHVNQLPEDLISDVLKSANSTLLATATSRFSESANEAQAFNNVASVPKNHHTKNAVANPGNEKFEAMMLRSFVEDMMPKASSDLYGEGTAGEVWRSMQADFISQEIAKGGGIGIAKQLDAQDQINRIGISPHSSSRDAFTASTQNMELNTHRTWPYFKLGALTADQA